MYNVYMAAAFSGPDIPKPAVRVELKDMESDQKNCFMHKVQTYICLVRVPNISLRGDSSVVCEDKECGSCSFVMGKR